MYVLADNRTEQKPKVSIIMPCYNHGKYVVDAIESVLNQTYQDYEFIVLENGSLDNSREVILQYRDKIDVIFGVDVNSIFGVSRLTEHCRGDYIAVIYSDDFWESEKLEKQMEAIEKYKVDFCFSQAIFTAEDLNKEIEGSRDLFKATNKKREKWIRQFFEHGNCLSNPSVVYKREYMDMVVVLLHLAFRNTNGYTASSGRLCHAVTSDMIFSLILLTSSGEMSTSYRLLICSEMSRWLILQAYNPRIFSSIPSAFRLYLPMICGSYSPFRSRRTFTSTAPSCVFTVFFEYPLR